MLEGDSTENKSTENPEREAAIEGDDASDKLFRVPIPRDPPTAPPSTPATNQEPHERRENAKLILEILGVIILIIYTIFTALQWSQIRRANNLTAQALQGSGDALSQTLKKMQGQIDAANTANNLSRQSIVGSQAASIITESPRPTPFSDDIELLRQQGLYLYFANIGRTPSEKFSAIASLTKKRLPSYKTIGIPQQRSTTSVQIRPGERMPTGIPGFQTEDVHLSFDMRTFSAKDLELIKNMDETVEVTGFTNYGDGFGNTLHNSFCFLYVSFPRHTFSESGATTGGGEGSWGLCNDMKHYIAQAEEWEKGNAKPN